MQVSPTEKYFPLALMVYCVEFETTPVTGIFSPKMRVSRLIALPASNNPVLVSTSTTVRKICEVTFDQIPLKLMSSRFDITATVELPIAMNPDKCTVNRSPTVIGACRTNPMFNLSVISPAEGLLNLIEGEPTNVPISWLYIEPASALQLILIDISLVLFVSREIEDCGGTSTAKRVFGSILCPACTTKVSTIPALPTLFCISTS